MTAVHAPAAATPVPAKPGRLRAAVRLLRLELRHNAMLWMLPVAVGLFWLTTYRKAMAMPPLWDLRATSMQSGALVAFACPVAGAAAWMGSREARRRTSDLVAITARPRWARLLAIWAATTCWAIVGYLGCAAALYGVTAQQAPWGGPLWWPAAVVAVGLTTLSAFGFAAGTLVPSRFTAPLAAITAFFALALSTQLIHGSQSFWQISPLVTGPWDIGPNAGLATFYPYLPDLPIAQTMFLAGLTIAALGALALPKGSGGRSLRAGAAAVTAAGLLTAGTAVVLAGTGKLDAHGMIAIPALHDSASDRPTHFTPVCSHTAIPVCVNPAYASYLPGTAAALGPVLNEIAGLPGAPARISQAAATYRQGAGNGIGVRLAGPTISGTPPVYHVLLTDQLLAGPNVSTSQMASTMRATAGPALIASVTGTGASRAQRAVTETLMMAAHLPLQSLAPPQGRGRYQPPPWLLPGSPVYAAASRFAALPASARHAWLERHLAALRAGQITLARLP
jgi:hypothetical protein